MQTLEDLLGLPQVPVTVFERPPLILTLCQVRFTEVLRVADQVAVAKFQEAIQGDFPIPVPADEMELQVQVGGTNARFQQDRLWAFTDTEDVWRLVLTQTFLSLETRSYDNFDDFLGRLRKALIAFTNHFSPALVTRIGLRYINEIRGNGVDWSDIINAHLLSPLAVEELRDSIQRVVQEIVLQFPANRGITVRHGLFPGGTTVQPRPEEAFLGANPFYLLDFDAFSTRSLQKMDIDAICAQAGEFNQAIHALFRWSITSEYAETLGVRRHASC